MTSNFSTKSGNGEPGYEPIYTTADAARSLNHFVGIGYERPLPVLPGVTVTFYDAGHILGSAIVVLDIEDDGAGRPARLVFSGDLGRP
jgi:metallo-beta-lactamase family protein